MKLHMKYIQQQVNTNKLKLYQMVEWIFKILIGNLLWSASLNFSLLKKHPHIYLLILQLGDL